MNAKKLLYALAAIVLIVILGKAFLPEWIVSGFHIG
jgi:hypothetical protein